MAQIEAEGCNALQALGASSDRAVCHPRGGARIPSGADEGRQALGVPVDQTVRGLSSALAAPAGLSGA